MFRFRTLPMFLVPLLLVGCFAQLTPQLLSTPYQEPLKSFRELNDDFSGIDLDSHWRRVAGWWRVKEGQLFQTLPWKSSLPGEYQMIYVYGLTSGAYETETRLNILKEGDQSAGILFRVQDQNNFYLLRLHHYLKWQDYIDLTQYVSGVRREDLRKAELTLKPGDWYALRVEDRGNEVICYLDSNELFRYPTPDKATGTVGLATCQGSVTFDYFNTSYYNANEPEEKIIPRETSQDSPPYRPYFSRAGSSFAENPPLEKFTPEKSDSGN